MSSSSIPVPFPNSYWVIPKLFLAGEHPIDYGDEATKTRLSALLDCGVRTFLDLTQVHEFESYGRVLDSICSQRSIDGNHRRFGIRDRSVPTDSKIIEVLDEIDSSIKQGRAVYVHCFAGIGRTGTIVGCYLMRHGLADRSDVISKIAHLRSFMPDSDGPSPHTDEQIGVVERWQKGA